MTRNRNRLFKPISIKLFIVMAFILSVTLTVSGIGYVVFTRWISSNEMVINRLAGNLNEEIVHKIEVYLQKPEHMIEVNHGILEKKIVEIENEHQRDKFFVNNIETQENTIYSFSIGTEAGEYFGARRNTSNDIEIMKNNSDTGGNSWYYSINEDGTAGDLANEAGLFDVRTRAWYKAAVKSNEFVFSPIYKHFVMNDLTISAATPIHDELGRIKGVLGVHVLLSGLNKSLKEVTIQNEAYALIVERESGHIVANSMGQDNYVIGLDSSFGRLNIAYTENRVALKTYQEYIKGNNGIIQGFRGEEKLFAKAVEFKRPGIDWLVITAIPESLLGASVGDSVKDSVLLGLAGLLLSILLFLVITRKMSEPVKTILDANERFSNGDLTQRIEVVRRDELGKIAGSFNQMAERINKLVLNLEDQVSERTEGIRLANLELEDSRERLQLLLDSTAEGIYGLDMEGNCTFINKSAVVMLGFSSQEELLGKNMHNLIHHSYGSGLPMSMEECIIAEGIKNGRGIRSDNEIFWRSDNTSFSVECFSYPQIEDGKVVGGVITFLDNSERKRLQQQIYTDKEQYRTTLLSVGDAVISTDANGRIEVMNPVAEILTGWTQIEAKGWHSETVFHIINEFTGEECENPVQRVLESAEIIELANHTILVSKDGKRIPIEDSAAPIINTDGKITGVVIVFRDFSDKKERIDKIEYLSFHDYLTSLYNRRYMEDSIKRLDNPRSIPFTIMAIDVNGLKLTNDAFGHKMGDRLLTSVADLLKKVCREDDIIGRMGGDEFMILLPKTEKEQAEKIKKRIEDAARGIKLDSVIVSLAVGFSSKLDMETDISTVMTIADNNMYKDKLKYGKLMRSQTIETVLRNINLKYDSEQVHTERVSQYCVAIAREMGFSDADIENIKTAAVLHDIGKIMVPPELLNKPGRLTQEEFDIIRKHPETGYQILKSVDEYASLASYVLHHHERIDGKGYPEGLKGDDIPVVSRIIAVADAYEAMTAERSYQNKRTKEDAIEELIRWSGKQFDLEIVKIFVEKVL
jgi:diguanylate cyclase (GGDEF)-like protein/PAS domain S-box-containing protein/putative nucleotidyltransferase with HDIG domain